MLENLKKEANITYTENGAVTNLSTMSYVLDLFATIGALRQANEKEIVGRFTKAYTEAPELALKTLFYARDVRGGLGERRVFRVILKHLCVFHPDAVKKNIESIAEYGRYDDLLVLMGTPCQVSAIEYIRQSLEKDLCDMEKGNPVSLLAKWLPSVNTSNAEAVKNAKIIAKQLGMTEKQYRQTLTKLRSYIRIIENNLRTRDYTFDYAAQPSKAMFKYREAFCRNDGERYRSYLEQVRAGNIKLNTSTLYPYEIIRPLLRNALDEDEQAAIDTTWNALPDYTSEENTLVVVDGSGSMYSYGDPMPATVALSLGIYYAERNKGRFANHFITFSENPQLVEIKGNNISEKVRYCAEFNEVANTNIQKVFELILNTAVKYSTPKKEMPSKIYIISDMEFDWCAEDASLTNFEYAKRLFNEAGYELPELVFWNVQSRRRQQPVTKNEQGVILVSGCTTAIFSRVVKGNTDPYTYMLEILSDERYSKITA
ncbi:MAG: DUF2828 family protein [Clostridia bacterium]|nr:DUF2828 family protein [Clostridia bacterium]